MNHYLMPRALTPEDVSAAAEALGFRLTVSSGPPDTRSGVAPGEQQLAGRHEQDEAAKRDTTVLLATLEALIVRWQIDQDLRDTTTDASRQDIAAHAQEVVGEHAVDALAAAMRRVETVQGLLPDIYPHAHSATTSSSADVAVTNGPAVSILLNAAMLLLGVSASDRVHDSPDMAAAASMLPADTTTMLVAEAARQVKALGGMLDKWMDAHGYAGKPA